MVGQQAKATSAEASDLLSVEDFLASAVDLFDRSSLLRWLQWADVGLLDTNWLVSASQEIIKQRRQDLPAEAFVPLSDVGSKPIVSFTYGWNHPANPDPAGNYASALQKYFGRSGNAWGVDSLEGANGLLFGKTKYPNGAALFWDHKSLYQHKIGMGWDGSHDSWEAHLIARRTDAEEKSFKRALSSMEVLYFHAEADTIVMTQVPGDGKNPTPYEKRGWTAMECAGAGLSGKISPLFLNGEQSVTFNAATPMTPEDFSKELATRKFTDSGDVELVRSMYRAGFQAYASQAKELYVNVGSASGDKCALLARSLLMFQGLTTFRLQGYPTRGSPPFPDLDRALDSLVAKGCEVLAGRTLAGMKPWPRRA